MRRIQSSPLSHFFMWSNFPSCSLSPSLGPSFVSALLRLTDCNLQVKQGFLPPKINWSLFFDIKAFGSWWFLWSYQYNQKLSGVPFLYIYTFHASFSRSSCPVHFTSCLIKPSVSLIFFSFHIYNLLFLSCFPSSPSLILCVHHPLLCHAFICSLWTPKSVYFFPLNIFV